ncbi:MAG: peptidase M13 [Candidatus Xenobia bacterium]
MLKLRTALTGAVLLLSLLAPLPAQEGLDLKDLDPKVSPCSDFYQYANGGWLARNPIPADRARWGAFNALLDRNQQILHKILEQAALAKSAPGSIEQKIGDFYASGMNVEQIDQAGLAPLKPLLDKIDAVKTEQELQTVIAELHMVGVNAYFNFYSQQDYKNSRLVVGAATQDGLGLPDRDYYFRPDDEKLREQYRAHLERMLELTGQDKKLAGPIYELEKSLAEASYDKVKMRDPDNTYHPTDLAGLQKLTPHFDWKAYFERIGRPDLTSINMEIPEFFQRVDQILTTTPLAEQRAYLKWQLIHDLASTLSQNIELEDYRFSSETLQGTKAQLPRWKRIVAFTDRYLGEALGQKYVEQTFSPTAKARVKKLVENLLAALREDLKTLPWMSPATREAALVKLNSFRYKIGYPDSWTDYSTLAIDRGPFAGNVLRGRNFAVKLDLDKIGKPVDPDFWYMSPPTVNAYYDPSNNEIVFPAGILQPPFFSEKAPDALNYGGIGAVIGHEITHGFDDQGARFDGQGNLKNWWTPEDLAAFQKRSKAVVQEYSGYEVEDKLFINGELVVGEAIADMGGLKLAYKALQRTQPPQTRVDGFTPEQLFFLGYARIWAMNMRPEYVRLQVKTDPHPHPRFRVNGPLSNMKEFYEAFKCPAGSPMHREAAKRTEIW